MEQRGGDHPSVDRYISGAEMELYEDTAGQNKISIAKASGEAAAHTDTGYETDDAAYARLIDDIKNNTTLFETAWQNDNVTLRPVRKGLIEHNNIYITLPSSQLLGMLTYTSYEEAGSIAFANVYVSNEDLEEGETAEDIQNWGEPVYEADELWTKYDAQDMSSNGHSVQWTPQQVQHIRIEVTHTWGTNYQTRNRYISGSFIRLYEAIPVTNVATDGLTTIAAYSGHSNAGGNSWNISNVINNKGNNASDDNERWLAGPNLKSGTTEDSKISGAVNYVVLDLGENTRTVVEHMEVRWHNIAYAKHYKIETSDTCTIETADINTAPYTDKKLTNVDEEGWELVHEVTRDSASSFPLDSVEGDGVRSDNTFFNNAIELKRYVRIVVDEMNVSAQANAVSIREWDIYGYKRQLGYNDIKTATVAVDLPVGGSNPTDGVSKDTDPKYEITSTVWTDSKGAVVEKTSEFSPYDTYTVTMTLTPQENYQFTVDSKITLQDQLGASYRAEKDLQPDGSLIISHTYSPEAKEPEKGEIIYTGLNLGTEDAGESRPDSAWFYGDMVDDATVTAVFKLSDTDGNSSYALLTLADDDGHHITLGYKPKTGQIYMSYKDEESNSTGGFFSANATSPFKVTDTNYHKISFSLLPDVGTQTSNKENGRLAIKIDGQQVLTTQNTSYFDHYFFNKFFTRSQAGWTPTKVYIGGTVGTPDSTLLPFSTIGSIEYVKVEKNQGFSAAIPNHTNVESIAAVKKQALLDTYARLAKDDYTTSSWTEAENAKTALEAATTEWAIWNAIDPMNTALNALVTKHIVQPLISVAAPKQGTQTADAVQVEKDERYTLTTEWYNGDDAESVNSKVELNTDFDTNKIYKVKVTLTAASGFDFRDADKPSNIKVGNVLIPLEENDVTVDTSSNTMIITYTFEKTNASTTELSALLSNNNYPEAQGNYTNESWAAYSDARNVARSLTTASANEEYVSQKSVSQAKTSLETTKNALLTRVGDPELQVDQPVYGGEQKAVTVHGEPGEYTISYKWFKVGAEGVTTEMPEGETYAAGTYKVTATLTANEKYGFDETCIPSHIHVGEETLGVEVAFDGATKLMVSWSCTIEEPIEESKVSRKWTVGPENTNKEHVMTAEDTAFFADLGEKSFAIDVVFRYTETGYSTVGKRNALVTLSDGTANMLGIWNDPQQTSGAQKGGTCIVGATTVDGLKFNQTPSYVGDTLWHKITVVIQKDGTTYTYYAAMDGKDTIYGGDTVRGWALSGTDHAVAVSGLLTRTWTPAKLYFGMTEPTIAFTTKGSFNATLDGTIKSVTIRKLDTVSADSVSADHRAVTAEAEAAYTAAVDACKDLVENKYTAESWAALQTALAADHSTEWAAYNAAEAILAAKDALVPDCGCTVTIDSFTLEDITLTGASATATLDAKVTATKGSECTEPDHTDTTANVVYTATGAGASVSGNTLTVTSAGNVTVTATATFNGKTATMDATAVVTSSALSDLNSYVDETREEYASQGDYSDASWGALQDALEAAEALKDQATVTEQEISDAKQAIEDAIAGLETQEEEDRRNLVNSLKDLMDEVEEKSQHSGDYDVDSYNELIEAYNAAVEVYNDNANKSKDELQAAFDALQAANDALKTKGEKAEEDLQKALEEAQQVLDAGQGNYTNEAWQAFQDAYNNAKNHASGLTAEEIQDLLNKLNAAKNALSGVDAGLAQAQANLNAMLADAKKTLDAGKGACPDAVWSAFQNAYNAANAGKNGTDAAKLVTLYNALKTALANVKSAQSASASNLPKPGSQYTVGKLVYQVKTSSVTDKTVMVVKPSKKTNKKLTIPATVKISGFAYKVVEIKQSAFAKNKKLTSVKIGKNVVKIGKKAFFRCAKLKKVTIKASGLKTVGKQAFAKINKKARIRVPKKQLKTLKKKLKKAKTIKSAKITK